MALRSFSSCQYSVFLSYAYKDDLAWNNWVSDFSYELNLGLEARIHGVRIPRTYLGRSNGAVHGPLSPSLRSAIDESFATILFVHDGYLESEWCLQELRHFKELAGGPGFRERLYLVALSKPAMLALQERQTWRDLVPYDDLIWLPFFQEDNPKRPIEIYATNARRRQIVVSNEFWGRFVDLRESLVEHIRHSQMQEERTLEYPGAVSTPAAGAARDQQLVRVYIEGKPEQERYWESLGEQIAAAWQQVVALERVEPPLRLRPTGLPITEIEERPLLDDADGVVLLWGRKAPESLAAQINRVEPKLSGPHFAPGLVAYILSDNQEQPPPRILNWPVVRFAVRDGAAIALADDAPQLAAFLKDVLARKRGGA